MKNNIFKIIFIFIVVSTTVFTMSCKKDLQESKPTFWPDIKINGSDFVVLNLGDPYTDLGATVTVNGSAIAYDAVSDVDSSILGAYTVVYSAENTDGISASKTRTVIVVDTTGGLNSDNLSGSFTRVGVPGTEINWIKDPSQPYTYHANNLGGVSPTNTSYGLFNATFVAYNVASETVVIPNQDLGGIGFCSALESFGGSPLIYFNKNANSGDVAYALVAIGPNFGTGLRTFKKI